MWNWEKTARGIKSEQNCQKPEKQDQQNTKTKTDDRFIQQTDVIDLKFRVLSDYLTLAIEAIVITSPISSSHSQFGYKQHE